MDSFNNMNIQRMVANHKKKEKLEMSSILIKKIFSLTRDNRIIIMTSQNRFDKSSETISTAIRVCSLILCKNEQITLSNILIKSSISISLLDKEILKMKKALPSTTGIKEIGEYLWKKVNESCIKTLCIVISGKVRSKRTSKVIIKKVNINKELKSRKQDKTIIRRKHLLSTGIIGIKIIFS